MKILLFGATGSAGGSVLRVCLQSPQVDEVRIIVRRGPAFAHTKLRALIHADFQDYTKVADAFAGVDACLFCLGKSVSQVSGEEEYRKITHDFAMAAARALQAKNPAAAFHFISGQGTNLNSRMMWARVKAETERDLMQLCDAVCWRPGAIDGVSSESAPRVYRFTRPFFRVLRPFRSLYVSGEDLGRAMLRAVAQNMRGAIIENAQIRDLAEQSPTSSPQRHEGAEL